MLVIIPKRIQLRRTKGWRKPEGAIVVSRPSTWGNPYSVEVYGNRESAVGEFQRFLDTRRQGWRQDSWYVRGAHYPSDHEIRAELAGRDLCCWCPLDQPCHGDVLLDVANS